MSIKHRLFDFEDALSSITKDLGGETSDIRIFTNLSQDEILAFSALMAWQTIGHSSVLDAFVDWFLHLRPSKNGQGRKEIVKVLTSFGKTISEKAKEKLGK
jgi:hypothetical protein